MRKLIFERTSKLEKPSFLTGDEAASLLSSAKPRGYTDKDIHPLSASALGGLMFGDIVNVTPEDVGKVPTNGKLRSLNFEEIVIETGGDLATVNVHFPRLAFSVARA